MSSADYYNQRPHLDAGSQYSGYYGGRSSPSASSQQHLAPGGQPSQGVSPFETAFDDHVYPASSYRPTPASSHHGLSHQDPDTGYHGASSDDIAYQAYHHQADDIPLRANPQRLSVKDAEMPDHVYDAPQPRPERRRRIRFGELGMLGSNHKKIPLVVYFFTVVQIAVFVAEIVKNGKPHPFQSIESLRIAGLTCMCVQQPSQVRPLCSSPASTPWSAPPLMFS